MARLIVGIIIGVSLSALSQANAGIISHIVAYQIGKNAGEEKYKQDCVCPPNEKIKP